MPKRVTPLRSQPCQDCSKTFDVYHRFQVRCENCQTVYRNTRKKTYNLVCQTCANPFIARNHRTKNCPTCAVTAICKTCGNEFEKTNYQHRHYCSESCSNRYKAELYFGGNYLTVLERDGFKCRKCGSHQSHHVHHIDLSGRFKKTNRELCNNNLDNLITLCNACHQSLHNELEYQLAQRHLQEVLVITNEFMSAKL